jgi:site-specific DNA-cytosine methylase
MKHASIIPLIGGETIGCEYAFGSPPDYFLSYEPFQSNDQHILNYYNKEIPYYLLDKNQKYPYKVDVISTVCPCAGLSQLSTIAGENNIANRWLLDTTKFVLEEMKPIVFWGENAPGLAGTIGKGIRDKLYATAIDCGYSMTLYRTRSLLHGVPQIRERTFYFFWRGNKVPLINYFSRKHTPIETVICESRGNTQQETINKNTPSKDPYYRYILEVLFDGITHSKFSEIIEPRAARGNDTLSYIEKQNISYAQLSDWMQMHGYDKEAAACIRRYNKLNDGKQIMRRGIIVPKDYIGAFVGHHPYSVTHPIEDRFITYREAMTIMGLPDNFELIEPRKNVNHICQNVPVQTATDMANEVLAYLNDKRTMIDSRMIFQYNQQRKENIINTNNGTLEIFFN